MTPKGIFNSRVFDIYEEESNEPLGVYLSLDDAIRQASRCPDDFGLVAADVDFAVIVIRKRFIGEKGFGQDAWRREWKTVEVEGSEDEYRWEMEPESSQSISPKPNR